MLRRDQSLEPGAALVVAPRWSCPLHTYQGLLTHLDTLTRNDLRYGTNGPTVPTLAEPTPVQRRAFQLIGAPIQTTLN